MAEHIPLQEPVVAYRGWFARPIAAFSFMGMGSESVRAVAPEGCEYALFPMSNVVAWAIGENTAVCRPPAYYNDEAPPPHRGVPEEKCGCGLHSHPRLSQVLNQCTFPSFGISPQWVLGAVLTWGRMFCGGKTIRAEHAEVLALAGLTDKDLAAHAIARAYGVPCVPRENLRDVALEHGHELPDEVLHEIRGGGSDFGEIEGP